MNNINSLVLILSTSELVEHRILPRYVPYSTAKESTICSFTVMLGYVE